MSRARKFAHVDRVAIERALADCGHVAADAADALGMSREYLYTLVRRFGITLPPRQRQEEQRRAMRSTQPRPPAERHPDTVAVIAEMQRLRGTARLLIRRPGPRVIQELLAIEARHRELRERLRVAMGPGECRPRTTHWDAMAADAW